MDLAANAPPEPAPPEPAPPDAALEQHGGRFARLRERMLGPLRAEAPCHIAAYAGYGTAQGVRLRGRVLRGPPIPPGHADDQIWRNLLAIYTRLESDEAPGARLRLEMGGATVEVITDDEGYYDCWLTPAHLSPEPWQQGRAQLLSLRGQPPGPEAAGPEAASSEASGSETPGLQAPVPDDEPVLAEAPLAALVPTAPSFGVISDIDDTVLVSDATHLLRMAQWLLLGNAETRLPFPGVAALYQALQQGAQGLNPIFYVSSSPWNLYDLLTDFFALNGIPPGPLFLRDFGWRMNPGAGGHHGHKLDAIEEIMALWPALPFVLMGDSGQQDPEIYAETVRRHGDRIRAVYIRDVSGDARDREVGLLAAEAARFGVPMLLTPDSFAARAHAEQLGLIAPATPPAPQRPASEGNA